LSGKIKKGIQMDQKNILNIALQVAKGLHVLHTVFHVAHLDIKPDNILESSSNCYKIADFGLVTPIKEDPQSVDTVGDKRYLPVEGLDDKLSHIEKMDMFALGVTLYELALGKSLSDCSIEYERIRNGDLDIKLSPFLNDLIRDLLVRNPSERLSAQEVVHRIQDYYDEKQTKIRLLESELEQAKSLLTNNNNSNNNNNRS